MYGVQFVKTVFTLVKYSGHRRHKLWYSFVCIPYRPLVGWWWVVDCKQHPMATILRKRTNERREPFVRSFWFASFTRLQHLPTYLLYLLCALTDVSYSSTDEQTSERARERANERMVRGVRSRRSLARSLVCNTYLPMMIPALRGPFIYLCALTYYAIHAYGRTNE